MEILFPSAHGRRRRRRRRRRVTCGL